jgi:PadR family transcriptional regulator PadR
MPSSVGSPTTLYPTLRSCYGHRKGWVIHMYASHIDLAAMCAYRYGELMSSSAHHSEVSQPKRFLQPCLLLLIAECPGHGYDLLERLGAFGFERDPGGLYRALRSMEREGLVRSEWQLSEAGPGRRCYEVTTPGQDRLRTWGAVLTQTRQIVETYLNRYEIVKARAGVAERSRTGT